MDKYWIFLSYLLLVSGKNSNTKYRSSGRINKDSESVNKSQAKTFGTYKENYITHQREAKPADSARTKVFDVQDDGSPPGPSPLIDLNHNLPAAAGVAAQGLLWLRELGTAAGSPVVISILILPLFLLATATLFIPDWTNPNNILYTSEYSAMREFFDISKMWSK